MTTTKLTGTRDTLALLRRIVACRPSLPLTMLPELRAWQRGEFTGIPVPVDATPGDWICFCDEDSHRLDDELSCVECGAKAPAVPGFRS